MLSSVLEIFYGLVIFNAVFYFFQSLLKRNCKEFPLNIIFDIRQVSLSYGRCSTIKAKRNAIQPRKKKKIIEVSKNKPIWPKLWKQLLFYILKNCCNFHKLLLQQGPLKHFFSRFMTHLKFIMYCNYQPPQQELFARSCELRA